MEGMGTYNWTENNYGNWLTFFYYYSLNGYAVNDALYWASRAVNCPLGWTDPANRLYTGYDYIWWGGAGQSYDEIWGRLRVYGNGNVTL
jgi:hypothetical protein